MVGPARAYEAAGELLKVLSAPARLGIVACLDEQPRNVGELATLLELSQPLVSQHLRVLRGARLVEVDRRGRQAVYSLSDDHVAHIVGDAITHSKELQMSTTEHEIHTEHTHVHGDGCGHAAVTHDDHTDYIHDGHAHSAHDDHWDEHPVGHAPHDDHDHEHGPECGHEAVDHDGHTDYIHDGHAHSAHDGHWDEH